MDGTAETCNGANARRLLTVVLMIGDDGGAKAATNERGADAVTAAANTARAACRKERVMMKFVFVVDDDCSLFCLS